MISILLSSLTRFWESLLLYSKSIWAELFFLNSLATYSIRSYSRRSRLTFSSSYLNAVWSCSIFSTYSSFFSSKSGLISVTKSREPSRSMFAELKSNILFCRSLYLKLASSLATHLKLCTSFTWSKCSFRVLHTSAKSRSKPSYTAFSRQIYSSVALISPLSYSAYSVNITVWFPIWATSSTEKVCSCTMICRLARSVSKLLWFASISAIPKVAYSCSSSHSLSCLSNSSISACAFSNY